MEEEYEYGQGTSGCGQATITFSHMSSFGDYTNFECSLRDETADTMVEAFRRFLLSVGFMPGTVDDVLGEEE